MKIQKIRDLEIVEKQRAVRSTARRVDAGISVSDLKFLNRLFRYEATYHKESTDKTKGYEINDKSYFMTLEGDLLNDVIEWGKKFFIHEILPCTIESVRVYYLDESQSLASHVHVDAPDNLGLDYINYKSIMIPYNINNCFDNVIWRNSKSVFLKQYYDHNGCWLDKTLPEKFWKLTAPELIENKTNEPFDKNFYEEHLDHLNYEELFGLTPDEAISWYPGSVIILDRSQLHSSNHFEKQGIVQRGHMLFHTRIDI